MVQASSIMLKSFILFCTVLHADTKPCVVKRSRASYHKAVPEHFDMHEHGPEIHLDIDDCGTRVDTHPAALSVDTSTHPQEHCCRSCSECHHCCSECCHSSDECCHGYCCRRDLTGGHENYEDSHNPGAQLVQHTVEGEMMGRCIGGICRDEITRDKPFQYSEHSKITPMRSVYVSNGGKAQIESLDSMGVVAGDDNQIGLQRLSKDGRVSHSTGEARGRIVNNLLKNKHITSSLSLALGSQPSDYRPKLLIFGRSQDGLVLTDDDVSHPYKSEASSLSKLDSSLPGADSRALLNEATITHKAQAEDKTGVTRGLGNDLWSKYNAIADELPVHSDEQLISSDRPVEGLAEPNKATITHKTQVEEKTGVTRGLGTDLWSKYNAIADGLPSYSDGK